MEEKPTMSDIDLDKILSTPQEVPHSVEVVLRKLEIAEMGRAKRVSHIPKMVPLVTPMPI